MSWGARSGLVLCIAPCSMAGLSSLFFFLEAVMLRLSNQAIKGVTCPLLGNLCKMRVPKPQVPLETTSCTSAEAFVSTWPWREILPSANPPRGLVSVRVSWSSESKAEPGSSGVQALLRACSPVLPAVPPKQALLRAQKWLPSHLAAARMSRVLGHRKQGTLGSCSQELPKQLPLSAV